MDNRVLCHFSCGVASAVATFLALKKYGDRCEVVNIYVADEHEDNRRFLRDCEAWLGVEIKQLCRDEYGGSVDEVIERHRYMRGPRGARCTVELKKAVRLEVQRPSDMHIFGYTHGEQKRVERIMGANLGMELEFPLIDNMLTHQDCLAVINDVGIELPVMYKMGFAHNNCVGCLKSESPAYWLLIKKHFPDVFWKRAAQERDLGYALCRVKKQPVFLDELEDREYDEPELDLSCSLLCQIVVSE